MRDPTSVKLDVDADGALVTLEAGSSFVCFLPGLNKQWWHPFVNRRHKHVFAVRPAGPDAWTLLEPWRQRLLTASTTSMHAKKFLLWGARSRPGAPKPFCMPCGGDLALPSHPLLETAHA